jgi:hypothetical protein
MEIRFANTSPSIPLARLRIQIGLTGPLRYGLYASAPVELILASNCLVDLHCFGLKIGPLRLHGRHGNLLEAVPSGPDRAETVRRWRFVQRRSDEGVYEVIARLKLQRDWVKPDGDDAPLDIENQGLPPGCCLVIPPGEDGTNLEQQVATLLGQRVPEFIGVATGPLLDGQARGPCRMRFYLPSATDPNHLLSLGSGWQIAALDGRSDFRIMRRFAGLDEEAVQKITKQCFDPDCRRIEVEGKPVFPRLPMSISIEGQCYFCREIEFAFEHDNKSELWDLTVYLTATDDPWGCRSLSRYVPPCLILGEIVDSPSKEGAHLFRVRPPNGHKSDSIEPELRDHMDWQMIPSDAPLIAARAVPGFVRPHEVAFYTRLREGDLVLIRIADGALPIILGSLHDHRHHWENQGTDIGCAAETVDFGPRLDKETGPSLRIGDSSALLSAPKEVVLKSPKVSCTGQLETAGDVSFKGNVTLD